MTWAELSRYLGLQENWKKFRIVARQMTQKLQYAGFKVSGNAVVSGAKFHSENRMDKLGTGFLPREDRTPPARGVACRDRRLLAHAPTRLRRTFNTKCWLQRAPGEDDLVPHSFSGTTKGIERGRLCGAARSETPSSSAASMWHMWCVRCSVLGARFLALQRPQRSATSATCRPLFVPKFGLKLTETHRTSSASARCLQLAASVRADGSGHPMSIRGLTDTRSLVDH